MRILSGKTARDALAQDLSARFEIYSPKPKLAIIKVGNDPASDTYVKNKKLFGESVGAEVSVLEFPESISETELLEIITQLNTETSTHGIIVQSPLPLLLSFENISSRVAPIKDVDGLVTNSPYIPATARGVMALLSYYEIPVAGKNVAVIGRSKMVGTPIANELTKLGAIVTVCHSQTVDLVADTKKADILIVAMGKPEFINASHVSAGQIVIDVGIHRKDDSLVGDVDRKAVEPIIAALSPVPGGVGPMTVFALFENLEKAYINQAIS